jgi:hypothetical protein
MDVSDMLPLMTAHFEAQRFGMRRTNASSFALAQV